MSTYAESERTVWDRGDLTRYPAWFIRQPKDGVTGDERVRLHVKGNLTLAEADMLATSILMYIHEAQEAAPERITTGDPMTPEEAQALEPGTTPGPWAHDEVPGPGEDPTRATEVYPQDESGVIAYVQPNAADVALIAAAPAMRATIAAQTWEWAVQVETSPGHWLTTGSPWQPSREGAEAEMSNPNVVPTRWKARLVRRPVGPVEVVEG